MRTEDFLTRFTGQIVEYLPSLMGGLLLIVVGAAVAWFVKRVIVQICLILRLGRLLRGFRWARGIAGADVRHSLYGVLGSIGGVIVFLVFLDAAFIAMRLAVVAALLEKAVFLVPRVLAALAIFGLGWLVSFWTSMAVRRSLYREDIPRAALVATYIRGAVLLLFAAMALAELDVAREIVVIGFTVIYITLGVLTVIFSFAGARRFVHSVFEEPGKEQRA